MRTFTQKLAFLLMTLLCCVAMPQVVKAQTCVEIGDGTYSSNQLPICGYYHSSYTQQLYLADELEISAGNITSIAFKYTDASSTKRMISIFMANTDAASLSSAYVTDAEFTEVLSQSVVEFDNSNDWFVIDLETPFAYDGSSNLLVVVYMSYSSAEETHYGSDSRFAYTSATGMARYTTNDYTSSATELTVVDGVLTGNTNSYTGINGTSSSYRSNMQFCYTTGGGGPTCDKPESCDITDISTNGATVNFAGGSGVYNVEIKGGAYADWTFAIKNTNLTYYTLSDLTPNTSYQVRVTSVCGDNTSSSKSASFKTLVGLPFAENFNSGSLPEGWKAPSGKLIGDSVTFSGSGAWTFGSSNGVFDSHARANVFSNSQKWLILPEILIPMMEEGDLGYQMTFSLALTKYSGTLTPVTAGSQADDRFIVLASLDGGANWNILQEWNNTGSEFVYDNIACSAEGEEVSIDISAYAGQSIQLAFYGESTQSGGDNNIHIDDVLVDRIPTCLKPTDLHEVEGMTTKNSLQVAWTANSEETDWRVQHKVSNDTTAEWITTDVSTNPYTILGLQPFTNYDVRVAAVCTETDFTDYGKAITIKTAAGVPFEETFDTTALPGEWKRYEVLLEDLQNSSPMEPVSAGWNVAAANGVFPAANRHLRLNITGADCKYWIVSPMIVMEAGYQLTFDLALTKAAGSTPTAVTPGEQNDDKFIVFITSDGGENWNPIQTLTWTNSGEGQVYDQIKPDGQFAKYDLSDYAGQSIQIAFYGESTDADSQSSNYLHIANFKIAEIPACEKANSLLVTDITGSSATAVWEADEAGTWQYGYVVKPEGDFTPTDEQFTGSTEELTVNLTDLQETTTYIFFLRKSCGGSTSEILYKEFTTIQTPAALPYSADFEENNGGWLFHNGTQPNKWAWGTATNNGGTHALYISNDNGESNEYTNNSTSIVYVAKTFYFDETGMYSFSYDWKANGEGATNDWDYLRVVLVPNSVEFTPGTRPTGFTNTAVPAGWLALDGGGLLNLKSEWQHHTSDVAIDQIGLYKVVIMWKNDGSGGKNPPAAIDNFSIAHLDCAKPTGLALSEVEYETATLIWNEEPDGLTWVYAVAPAEEGEPEDEAFQPIVTNSVALEGLTINTNYKFYLRKQCGEAFSESISIAFKTLNPNQITVNEGTETNSYVPIYGTWVDNYTHSQFIIPAASLEALMWDTITTLTFYTSAAVDSWGAARFEAYMGSAQNTTLSGLVDWTSLTKVMNEAALSVVDQQMVVELSTPFVYTGGNLLIGFDQTISGTFKAASWYGVSAASGASYGGYGTSVSAQSFLPKVSFDIIPGQAPACSAPTGLHAVDSLIATNSAVLTWTPQSAEPDFAIRYKEYEAADWADTLYVLGKDSFLLDGLNPATIYEAQVAAWCDATDPEAIGEFGSSAIFATNCVAVADINEDFEGSLLCWSAIQESGTSGNYPAIVDASAYPGYVTSGTHAAYFLSQHALTPVDQYLILPELISLDNKRIKFNVRKEDDSDENTYAIVGVMTNPADSTSFEALDSLLVDANVYSQRFVSLDAYAGTGKYVAIKMPASTVDYASLIIDDVVVEDIPACAEPQGIHAIADSIASSSALLAWAPQGAESDWLVRYRISGAEDWADTIHATNDTLLIEGLASITTYEVQIAAWCDPTDDEAVSPFSSSIFFTTACGAISTLPYAENFDELPLASAYTPSARTLPLCWSAINTCTYSSYMYYPTAYYYSYTDYSNSQPNSLRFYSSYSSSSEYDPQDQYAILPQIEGISGLRMRFNARKYSSYNSGDSIVVGIMTDPEDVSTFEAIQVIKPAAATYEPFEVRFNNYAGEGQYIALKLEAANASNTSRGLYLDDIVVDELPSCFEPEGLAVFDIEENSAKFTWTVEEGESYVYAVALASAGEPAEEAFAAAADSMQVSGLVDNKDYILYLRKNCAGNYSPSISAAFHTLMVPASVPYADDFEDGNNWMFINGSLTNAWAYGEADHNGEGTHAIYISNDGGASNAYNGSAPAVVYAVKSFDFEEGVYTFKYDWKANGESTFDYLRVALIPDSIELVAATSSPSGLSATAFPAAWHAIALDGGGKLNGVTSWQTFQATDIAISAGAYKVVFLWRDDTSTGSQTPAAIDNFSISKITCLPVSELAVSGITSSSATIAWTAPEGQEAWQLAYSADPNFDIAEATLIDVASTTHALAELLTDTLYNVYVRANCGSEDGVSVWSQISFRTAKACQTPDDLAAADIDASSALISWNTYGQSGFNLRYIQGTDIVLVPNVESPYELTGLQANTAYKVQVQAACESEDSWSAELNFRTDCDIWSIATDGRYVEDFESYAGTAYNVYNNQLSCWIMGGNATYLPHVANSGSFGYYPHSGTKALSFYGSANSVSYAVLPQFAEDLNGLQISFWAKVESASYGTMSLGYMTADSVFHQLTTVPCTTTNTKYEYILDTVPAVAGRLAFCWVFTGTSYYTAGIDDIEVEFIPTCLAPNAVAASDILAHSAKISWTNGAEGQDAWQIAIDTLPTNRPDTLLNIIDVTENPYVLAGLDPETRYYAYVRANCGAGDFSKFSDGINFLTTIACPAPTGLAAVLTPGDGSIATLNWNAGEAQAWQVEYSLNSNMLDSIVLNVTEPTINLSGLTAEQTYYARVKADCGELDGESLYSAIISFKPTDAYELLLNDGTATNQYVPVEGNYVDNATQRSQFVIPAAQLESLEWDSLTTLTFFGSFTTTSRTSWTGATFEAYVLEIEDATLAAEQDWASMTKVMNEASLALVDGKMIVSFSDPYQYQGGNLMIGIKTVQIGDYANVNWYGAAATGASFGGHGTSLTQRNFLPKMLINYVPGVAPACPNPKNLAVSGITDSEATFTWKAVEGATWEYALVEGAAEPAEFISTEDDSVTIANLAESTDYTFYLRRACGVDGYSDTISVAFTTDVHVDVVPFVEDFEDDGAWKFVNGTEPNAWVIGNAANNGGEKALYISNDGGVSNSYAKDSTSYSYATILLDFTLDGEYTFAYDWKANGDYDPDASELYDYLRVVLVPASATLVAGNPALPEGYIALDNGGLYGATEWQHHTSDAQIAAGLYKLVFAWFNDEQLGEDSPAAIDNISIQEKGQETGLINGNAGIFNNGEAFKFLRDNKVFILVNGVIYDATGRKVEVVK